MPKITFLPINKTCHADSGETILEVALNHDIPIQHACGGFCACTTCHVLLRSSEDTLSQKEEDELERIERVSGGPRLESRLGCQAKILKDVTVEIVNLDL